MCWIRTEASLQLPFWALRLLKPCKVKRFLATAALSEVGLVTASSEPRTKNKDTKKGKEGRKEEGKLSRCKRRKINEEGRSSTFQRRRQRFIISRGEAERCGLYSACTTNAKDRSALKRKLKMHLSTSAHLFHWALVRKRSWHQGCRAQLSSPLPF